MFHDLRHPVVTRLLEAGEPDHVVESITEHLWRRMLEPYSHIRLNAKKSALDRLDESGRVGSIKDGQMTSRNVSTGALAG
jgi:hypothetical protein